jgi:2'-5' RNA ligase
MLSGETDMLASLRVFVALLLPEAIADFLHRVRQELESQVMPVRWVDVAGIHLTLRFLGQIAPSQVAEIAARMDAVALATTPFQLRAQAAGAFPNVRRARVLWVGLGGDLAPLMSMQANLESGLESIGFARERRRFHPHLTMARTRHPIDPAVLGAGLEATRRMVSKPFAVDRLALIKSVLSPSGATHTRLHRSYLQGPPAPDIDRGGHST